MFIKYPTTGTTPEISYTTALPWLCYVHNTCP